MPSPSPILGGGSVQQGLYAAGGALGFYQLGLAADKRYSLAIKTMPSHKSDSAEQQAAESHMLQAIEKKLGLHFVAGDILGIGVKPDGIDPENKVIVEAYARVGKLKGAQLHKVKADILKLAYIEKKHGPGWRKIMCFGSVEAAAFLQGSSWAAEAARAFGIEIHVEPLPSEQAQLVKAAQERQRMVNPP